MATLRIVFGWGLCLVGAVACLASFGGLINCAAKMFAPFGRPLWGVAFIFLLLGGVGGGLVHAGRRLRFGGPPPPSLFHRLLSATWNAEQRLARFARGKSRAARVNWDEDLMEAVVWHGWPQTGLGRKLCLAAIIYVAVGALHFVAGDMILEVLPDDPIAESFEFYLILPAALAVGGLIFWRRRRYDFPGGRWILVGLSLLAMSAATAAYLPWLNATQSREARTTFSGPVVNLRMEEKEYLRSNNYRGQAARFFFLPIELITGSWDYFVTINDSVSPRPVTFKVQRREYYAATKGAMFTRTMRRGLLGRPYRWTWD